MNNINKKNLIIYLIMITVLFLSSCDQNVGKRIIEKSEKVKEK